MSKLQQSFCIVLTALACAVCANSVSANNVETDDFEGRSTWTQPTADEVRQQLDQWLTNSDFPEETVTQVIQAWAATDGMLLDRLAVTLAAADPQFDELVSYCSGPRTQLTTRAFPWLHAPTVEPALPVDDLDDKSEDADDERLEQDVAEDDATSDPKFAHNNLKLFFGRWLANNHLYNEAQDQLKDLTADDVVDPATLLFYQSVTHHRLLDKENALPTLARLLENEKEIPRRYSILARLMEADLKPLKPDSLDEISRLMDNIKVRLDHGRAGKRVRKEEDDVITKLDKMIEDLEKKAQQGQGGGGSQAGGNSPSTPMQDSQAGGIKGPGNVDPKRIGTQADWGNLPPKQREEALQRLGKDLPSHYRDVIQDYFRKLAQESEDSPSSSR